MKGRLDGPAGRHLPGDVARLPGDVARLVAALREIAALDPTPPAEITSDYQLEEHLAGQLGRARGIAQGALICSGFDKDEVDA